MKVETVIPRFAAAVVLALGLGLSPMALGGVAFGENAPAAKAAPEKASAENAVKGQAAVPPCGAMMGKDAPAACKKAMAERMAKWKKMQEKMDAQDAKLKDMVAKMNAASGSKKVDAMAAVVSELVSQHTSRRHAMMAMRSEMMKDCPMMPGAGRGMMMKDCPMMKGQSGAAGAAAPKMGGSE
jgi:hypothetical protein